MEKIKIKKRVSEKTKTLMIKLKFSPDCLFLSLTRSLFLFFSVYTNELRGEGNRGDPRKVKGEKLLNLLLFLLLPPRVRRT